MIFNKQKSNHILNLIFRISPIRTILQLLLSFLSAIMPTAVMALATKSFVDTALTVLQNGRPRQDVYLPFVFLLAVLAIHTTIGVLIQLLGSRLRLDIQRRLNPAVVEKQARLEYKHIEYADSWELISRVSRDPAASFMEGFDGYLQLLRIIISVAVVLGLILFHVWWAVLLIALFSVPLFLLSMQAGRKTYQAGRDAERFNRRTEYLSQVLSGREAVDERSLFGYGDEIEKRWQEQYEAGRKLKLKVSMKRFFITKGFSIILAVISLMIALTLIHPVITGQMSVGMFMGIVSVVFGLVQQLGWQMSRSLESISRGSEYRKDLAVFMALSETQDASCLPDSEPPAFKTLEFRKVSFRYPGEERYIFEGLSFVLTGGRHYAFVGKNGAGKTTVIKLLTGLYPQYEGEILIDGKELRDYKAGTIKSMFSVVYQDFSRYYIAFGENIMLGDAAAHDAGQRIAAAAELAGLQDTVSDLGKGLDTPLGKIRNGGQDISGGQWQRVAIARSLISRAPVKILDEPTAALDPISESRIYEEFEKLMAGKTTVFISHRLGSTKLADEILVLDNGRVAERGGHDELLAKEGLYATMFEAQGGWYQ